jgi:hypothetical protein
MRGYTWRALLPADPQQSEPARIFSNIKATVFNDAQLAYGPRPADSVGVSLPARFEKPAKLWIRNRANGLTTIAETIDVGPWNMNDLYWEHNGRPQAESGTDKQGRRTNRNNDEKPSRRDASQVDDTPPIVAPPVTAACEIGKADAAEHRAEQADMHQRTAERHPDACA